MSALSDALTKTVAELAKATAASADAIGVESLAELKKISVTATQAATTGSQIKVAIEASSKAEATNTTELKASIVTLNNNVLALLAQQVKSNKMQQLRWAYDKVDSFVFFMKENGIYVDQLFKKNYSQFTPEQKLVKLQDVIQSMLGKRPTLETSNGEQALFY